MKSFKKLMLLVMVAGGVGLSAEAPTNRTLGTATCPAGKVVVPEGYFSSCCPSCPRGKIAKIDTNDCICVMPSHSDRAKKAK